MFLPGDLDVRYLVAATVLALLVAYVATVHPASVFIGLAMTLGFVPYLDVPGTPVPVVLFLATGAWVALQFVPGVRFRPGWVEYLLLLMGGVALLSVAATNLSGDSAVELAAWFVATTIAVPVRFLPAELRAAMVRAFVLSAAGAAAWGCFC